MNLPISLDHLYKKLFAKMVAGLVKHIGIKDIALAEDIVQETFLAAHQQWSKNPPTHPEAWLFKVCKNIAMKTFQNKVGGVDWVDDKSFDQPFEFESEIDGAFWMLVACANPRFSPKQQVIFALRFAAGFKTDQIATVLGAQSETITKTLQRLRAIIKEERIKLYSERTLITKKIHNTLLRVLYLMFNEGYKTTRGKSILNTELCEDALSLTQIIIRDETLSSPEAKALYALMLFNLSRFEARFTPDGDLIDLENQDRNCWNQDMIRIATYYFNESMGSELSSYHLEAAMASLHCNAKSFEATDWGKIVSLYEQLLKINESPFVGLNLAIARFYAGNYIDALTAMRELGKIAFINHYYLYHVAMGKMLNKSSENEKALIHYQKALDLTPHPAEKRYIQKLME